MISLMKSLISRVNRELVNASHLYVRYAYDAPWKRDEALQQDARRDGR